MIPTFQQGQIGLSVISSAPTDPYFSNVKLLIRATEANGSTTPADSSSFARTITSSGGASVDTSLKKFTGSIGTNVTGPKYFSVAHSTDFNIATGAYTVDMWIYFRALPDSGLPFQSIFSKGSDTGNGPWCFIYWQSGSHFIYYRNNATELVTPVAHGMSPSIWYHLEISSNGTTHRIRKNGVTLTTGTNSIIDTTKTLLIGAEQNSGGSAIHVAQAQFEDFRWTGGVQRNASDFTAPTTKAPAS